MKRKGLLRRRSGGVTFEPRGGREGIVDPAVLEAASVPPLAKGARQRVWAWVVADEVLAVALEEEALVPPSPGTEPPGASGGAGAPRGAPSWPPRQESPARRARAECAFHNPYNFVPFVPRPDRAAVVGRAAGGDPAAQQQAARALALVDGPPPGHHVFHSDRHHGWIDVELTLATPMLLPEPPLSREPGHQTVPVLQRNDRPWLPPSSLKGALRAAYECITNSRLPRFDTHDRRLGYRMQTQDGLALVPARVVQRGDQLEVTVLPGTSRIGVGRPDGPQYAAWLPRYRGDGGLRRCDTGALPERGERVDCWVELFEHQRGFRFWQVRAIAAPGALGRAPEPTRGARGRHSPVGSERLRKITGWVLVTNQNIGNKHDERVFFSSQAPDVRCFEGDAAERIRRLWADVILGYQAAHTPDEIEGRVGPGQRGPVAPDVCLGNSPGQTAWSPHLYEADTLPLGGGGGTLCYLRLDGSEIVGLFPVNISRELFPCSPCELVPADHQPAETLEAFSPADRVFGWVHQKAGEQDRDQRAYRGHVRIEPITCLDDDAILDLGPDGLPLAVLGAPKPQQGRFYVGRSDGSAQEDGLSRDEAGYDRGEDKKLRGRKVYPHHRGQPEAVWDEPLVDRTAVDHGGGWHQEYRRPRGGGREQRDAQNRSVLGWVCAGARFSTRIWIDNLSEVELGALVYLLDGGTQGHHLRLGGGKPLGFGSAELRITGSGVRLGDAVAEGYRSLLAPPPAPDVSLEEARRAFVETSQALYRRWARSGVPLHLAAHERCAVGHLDELPVHIPRRTPRPDPEGQQHRWFSDNDSGHKLALGDLVDDPGLPYDPSRPDPQGRGGPRKPGRKNRR